MNKKVPRSRMLQAMSSDHVLPRKQQGVALAVALILLVVITLVGLAAVSGTILQNKMAANQYDRQIAFQSASAALRIAQKKIPDNPNQIAVNCYTSSFTCLPDPFSDPNVPASAIQTVSASDFKASAVATGQPQYIIESLGNNWINPDTKTGFNMTANSTQYGVYGKSRTSTYYRITARSADPKNVGDRAVVVVQAVVKQG